MAWLYFQSKILSATTGSVSRYLGMATFAWLGTIGGAGRASRLSLSTPTPNPMFINSYELIPQSHQIRVTHVASSR